LFENGPDTFDFSKIRRWRVRLTCARSVAGASG
jgi:hypothetical protein